MLHLTATIDKFNKQKYIKAVQEEMQRAFFRAGQRFLVAAVPRVPIWAGMARGAFRNAEDLFGKVSQDKTSGHRIRKHKRGGGHGRAAPVQYRRGYYYKPPGGGTIERSPEAGRQFSTPTNEIMQLEGAQVARGRYSFTLIYKIDITYFTKLDETKWGAMKAGQEAAEKYLLANLTLPDPLQYMERGQTRRST